MAHLVLFVHGLGGNAISFGLFPTLLKEDPELASQIEVEIWEYPTKGISFPFYKSSPPLLDLAKSLSTYLYYKKEDTVTLVCHSMGGLIARLMIHGDRGRGRLNKVVNLLLYATPNEGAKIARLGHILSPWQRQIEQLKPESDITEYLDDHWDSLEKELGLSMKYVVATLDSVVSKQSARRSRSSDTVEYVNYNHTNVVKPTSRNEITYLILQKLLVQYLSRGGSNAVNSKDSRPISKRLMGEITNLESGKQYSSVIACEGKIYNVPDGIELMLAVEVQTFFPFTDKPNGEWRIWPKENTLYVDKDGNWKATINHQSKSPGELFNVSLWALPPEAYQQVQIWLEEGRRKSEDDKDRFKGLIWINPGGERLHSVPNMIYK